MVNIDPRSDVETNSPYFENGRRCRIIIKRKSRRTRRKANKKKGTKREKEREIVNQRKGEERTKKSFTHIDK